MSDKFTKDIEQGSRLLDDKKELVIILTDLMFHLHKPKMKTIKGLDVSIEILKNFQSFLTESKKLIDKL